MKYNLHINQKKIVDSGIKIDLHDAVILDFLYSFSLSPNIEKKLLNNKLFCWFKYSYIVYNLPLLDLKKDSVYRRIKSMIDLKLLEPHPDNQVLGKSFFNITELTFTLFFERYTPTDENPNPLRIEVRTPTDENPYNSIINDNNKSLTDVKDSTQKLFEIPIKFKQPSIEEVTEHFKSSGSTKEIAKKFFNFYESKGWMVGKNKMKKWKSAASNFIDDNKPNQVSGNTETIKF